MKYPASKQSKVYSVGYSFPFACFECRKSFKRPYSPDHLERKCPHCGGTAVMLGRKFKAPAARDVKQWRKVQELVKAGFRFDSVMRHEGEGRYSTAKYPEKLSEVGAFIAEFRPRALGGISRRLKPSPKKTARGGR